MKETSLSDTRGSLVFEHDMSCGLTRTVRNMLGYEHMTSRRHGAQSGQASFLNSEICCRHTAG